MRPLLIVMLQIELWLSNQELVPLMGVIAIAAYKVAPHFSFGVIRSFVEHYFTLERDRVITVRRSRVHS